MVAVFLPVWILLLALLPFTGMGPLACLSLATLLAGGAVVLAERRRGRLQRRAAAPGGAAPGGGGRAGRGPMPASTAVLITLGVVALLVYVLFVIRAA